MQFVSADELQHTLGGNKPYDEQTTFERHKLKIIWAAVFAWIAFGGTILSVLEYNGEADRIQAFCALKREIDTDGQSQITDTLSSFASVGFCTVPSCNYQISPGVNGTNGTMTNSSHSSGNAAAHSDLNWTWLGACFFCLTSMTTIGYGGCL
jgi:hypothetical protein